MRPLLLAALVITPCYAAIDERDHLLALQAAAAKDPLDFTHGVTEAAAYKIGSRYFVGGCGAVCAPIDLKDKWVVRILMGVAAMPWRDVYIDKANGACTVVELMKASQPQPNQSPDPTSSSVTPPAGQESRRP